MEQQSVVELVKQYPTGEKLEHSYGPMYEELFAPIRDQVTSLLQIGVHQQASLKVWRDYFPHDHVGHEN